MAKITVSIPASTKSSIAATVAPIVLFRVAASSKRKSRIGSVVAGSPIIASRSSGPPAANAPRAAAFSPMNSIFEVRKEMKSLEPTVMITAAFSGLPSAAKDATVRST